MHSKVFQLAFIAIASFLSSPASAQEFMQDSIYYRIIDGKAGVCYVNKYNTVIPATVTHSGRTYPVSGFTMPESEWTHWRGIGNNVRMLTIPVTCDTIYSSKDGDIGNFLFSGGKNLSGITVEAPTSGKRHFLPCTPQQSTVKPYMPFGVLAYQKHKYTGSKDTICIYNVPPANARTRTTGICYVGTDGSTPTYLKGGAIHHLTCQTLSLASNIYSVSGPSVCVDPEWFANNSTCPPENYAPGQCSFKAFSFFSMVRRINNALPTPIIVGSSKYFSVDNGIAIYNKDYSTLMAYAPGADGTSYTVDSRCKTIGGGAFMGNMHLTNVVLPEGLEAIDHQAFCTTPHLRTVNIPSTLSKISFQAFCYSGISGTIDLSNCPNLGSQVFASSKNVKKIIFSPDSWDYEDELEHTIPENFITQYYVGPLSSDSIDGRGSLEEVVIPEGIETIGRYAFEGNSIKSLTLPSTMKTIKDEAFWYNDITGSLNLNNVDSLGYACFMHNEITSLNYSDGTSFTKFSDYCFAFNNLYCIADGSLFVIPEGIVSVGKGAFLKNNIGMLLTMSKLETIGDYAFACQQNSRPMNVLLFSPKLRNIGNSAFTNVLKFQIPTKGDLSLDRYGDLLTDGGTRLVCLSHASDDSTLYDSTIGSPYNYNASMAVYHHGEDRILPSTIKTIDDLALCYNELKRIVLPTGLTNLPFINSRSLQEMTIPDKLMASIAEEQRSRSSKSVFIPCLKKQTFSMKLEVGSAEDSFVATNDNPQPTLNVISEHADDIEDWAKSVIDKGYVGQILTNDSICKGWNAGKRGAQRHEVDFGSSTYKSFAVDYPTVFDDSIVRIVTKVDMDNAIVYTKKLPASKDGKYHVPARTGANGETYYGVILQKQDGKSIYSYRIDSNNATQSGFYDNNLLMAAPVCQWLDIPSGQYLLVLNGGAFKIVDNPGLIPAGKAYLYVSKDASTAAKAASTLTIMEDNTDAPSTGIRSLHNTGALQEEGVYYNVMGQRISHPQKSQLYIYNNRKYIQR